MSHFTISKSTTSALVLGAFWIAPLAAEERRDGTSEPATIAASEESGSNAVVIAQSAQSGSAQRGDGPPLPGGMDPEDVVFDETWLTVGVGAGLVPSYSGSDDYVLFPLPLIAGRVGGVGIRPAAAGLSLDLLSPELVQGPTGQQGPQFSLGPTFRIRNDRADRIEDEVVEAAGELDTALEVGLDGGISFPGVLNRFDQVTIGGAVRWDVLGAHDGMLIEPRIGYFTPLSQAAILTLSAGVQFVDDDFADYYYTVTPAQSEASGLPEFQAEGGLNSYGLNAILAYDLDGNALNGGFSLFGIASYSRLVNDGADTPFTEIQGSADQWVGGIGVGYTF